jgi:MarR family transcriptional regulator for hemolysin
MANTPCNTQFTIRLVSLVLRAWKSRAGERLKPLGITPSKCSVLFHLMEGGGTLPQRQLVSAVGVEKATLTRLLESMEEEGWVVRATGAADRRAKSVQATEAGRKLVPLAQAAFDQLFEETLEGTAPEERQAAAEFLYTLLRRLRIKPGLPDESVPDL